jgi:O-antigen ligase
VLVLAQSKTAWMAFLICSVCMLAVRHGPNVWRRLGDPREGAFGVLVCLCVMVGALGLMAAVLLGNVEGQLIDFLDTQQGAQLMSLSGRDQIWAIAIEEWQANRLFGYGPGLWDDAFRASIGMPNAINAHNQFMDTLARSGSLGAAALVLYASVLLVLSIRHARATGGLSLALFLALALLSISEVPLMLFAYGTELFAHLMLLVVLASAGAVRPAGAAARTRPVYGAAS